MKQLITYIFSFCLAIQINGQQQEQLIARNVGTKTLHDGSVIKVFGFAQEFGANPKVPGPTLEFTEGDSAVIDLYNLSQGAPHTIHLHGLDVNQANDGVGMLSFEVHHMEHGYYHFKVPHPGTYFYHCHVASPVHVQAGMYGLLIVRPAAQVNYTWDGGYRIDHEASLLMSEVDKNWHVDSILYHDHDTTMMYPVPIPKYDPQYFLINGQSETQIDNKIIVTGQAESNIYLRLSNMGFMANRVILPPALHARIIDSDGRALPQAENSDTVVIFPGERYGMLLQPMEEFTDSLAIQYYSLNTGAVASTQHVEVVIAGYLGINESNANCEVRLFPNPVGDQLFITSLNVGSVIAITDLSGRIFHSQSPCINEGSVVLDVNDLSAGIYIVSIVDKLQHKTIKFLKQ